jgi:phospholipase/carboxylesterase
VGPPRDVLWDGIEGGQLPHRVGPTPDVHWDIPQQQQSQNAPEPLQENLFERVSALAGVQCGPSHISVPGARAFTLPGGAGPDESYLVPGVREFAHLHPAYDGSLHVALPAAHAADLVAHSWGVPHPWAGTRLAAGFVMLFGPRTDDELETVTAIVTAAHGFASDKASA